MALTMIKQRLQPLPVHRTANMTRERKRGRAWVKLRDRILRRDPLCVSCAQAGRLTESVECDHRTPIHRGGADDEGTLQGLCRPCHRAKTATEAQAYADRD